jgi:energy-coupling factor transporter ATP-binding protein EcfA2
MSKSITIEDVQAIQSLDIQVPEQGGVVVLTGPNGCGKTTALNAIAEATQKGAGGKLTPRDGAKAGYIDAFGVTLKVGARVTRKGSLEITPLDSKLSPATLVDPGLKSADAADAARVRAVLRILGVVPTMSMFAELLKVGELASKDIEDAFDGQDVDVVAYAKEVQKQLNAKARSFEDEAERHKGRADAKRKALEGIDIESLPDPATANAELEQAITAAANLDKQKAMAEQLAEAASSARESLARAESVDEATIEEAAAAATETTERRNEIGTTVEKLGDQLQKAKELVAAAERELDDATRELDAAEQAEAAAQRRLDDLRELEAAQATIREAAQAAIDRSELTPIPAETELTAATEAVEKARQTVETLAVATKAQADVEAAKEFRQAARLATQSAEKCRDAAKATDKVLSDQIAGKVEGLAVMNGRLTYKTSRTEPVPFGELSHGERWKLALDIALTTVTREESELMTMGITQEAWEGLDDTNRQALKAAAVERGVVIFAAECSAAGPIAARVL